MMLAERIGTDISENILYTPRYTFKTSTNRKKDCLLLYYFQK